VDLELSDRVAVVTGGASGIGRACVERLVTEGAEVVILDRNPAGRDVAAGLATLGRTVTFVQCDISVESDVRAAFASVIDKHGRIDVLLCCAGISGPVGATAPDISVEDWDRVMAVNVRGSFLAAKHALPALTQSDVGAVMFVASDAALVAFEGMSPYCSSKGAVVMLAKALSTDFATVRFNCLCPGVVDTPMSRADLGLPDGFAETDLPVIPADQLAKQAVFLVSPTSYPINGTTVVSDFGYAARSALPTLQFTE
jgi:NAD(P)-dependent dehydrogenase (short-subunit alcohol dehydrogenase family)